MAVRRSPWLDNRAQLLVRLLAERGHEIGEDIAREDISDHLDLVAERMRIGRQAAKVYVTDEVIEDMAERIARMVAAFPRPDVGEPESAMPQAT